VKDKIKRIILVALFMGIVGEFGVLLDSLISGGIEEGSEFLF
jgi:hypothetical protein